AASAYRKAMEAFRTPPYQTSADASRRKPYQSGETSGSRGGKQPFAALTKGSQLTADKGGTLTYKPGDRVSHVKFGEGTVLDIKEGGRDYEVTVEFESAGVRKMFAMFAKLKKV